MQALRHLLIAVLLFFILGIIYPAYGQIISTIAGNGTMAYSGDGGPATAAGLGPGYVIFDAMGNMYISDGNNRIRMVNTYGIITTIAGNGTAGYSGDGLPATGSALYLPLGMAFDSIGNMYIADTRNNRIRKIDTAGIIFTIAGNGMPGYLGSGGPATAAELYGPVGITIDKTGNIYFTDATTVRKINNVGIITTIAGTGIPGFSGDGGPATVALLSDPLGIVLDSAGNIYVCDHANNRVRKIDTFGIITTFAGSGGIGGAGGGYGGDGSPATAALLHYPAGIAIDRYGNIYITDAINDRIRKVDAAGIITTIAGNGTHGFSGDGGPADSAELFGPGGITIDCAGNIFFADADNYRVRMIAYNHPPAFTGGHAQSITICGDTAINTLLEVLDIDTGQTETWSITQPAVHGLVVAGYVTTTTGGTLTPTGLTYTPASGYTGSDSFKVRVSDCGFFTDSTTVYVTVINCKLAASQIFKGGERLSIVPNPNEGTFTVSLRSSTDEAVQVVVTNVMGEKVKEVTAATNQPTVIKLDAPVGIYFLSAATAHGKWSGKVVVAR